MARGWESKSVEEQIEASREIKELAGGIPSRQSVSKPVPPSRERESLLLARTRILKDLQTTENERYRRLLEASLEAIEKQLAETK
jgi:hypothetical protein